MIVSFQDKSLEELYKLPINRLGKQPFSREIIINYRKRLDVLSNANDLSDVSKLTGMNLEKMKSTLYKGSYSIRVNKQYRVIFKEVKGGKIEVLILELSKHYE